MRPVTPYITMPSRRVAMPAFLPVAILCSDTSILSIWKTTAPGLLWRAIVIAGLVGMGREGRDVKMGGEAVAAR